MRLNVYLEKNISIFEFSIAIPKPISTIVSFSLEYVYICADGMNCFLLMRLSLRCSQVHFHIQSDVGSSLGWLAGIHLTMGAVWTMKG